MLILASLSGLQDYLFDVRETGGGQARSLRSRSFRIQLAAECVALRLLDAASLPYDRLLFCAAAKVAIDAAGMPQERLEAVLSVRENLQRELLRETHGRLRLQLVVQSAGTSFRTTYDQAGRMLARDKARPLRPPNRPGRREWDPDDLILAEPWDMDRDARRDADLGGELTRANWLAVYRTGTTPTRDAFPLLGLDIRLTREEPNDVSGLLSLSHLQNPEQPPRFMPERFHIRRLARHIPRDVDQRPIEFLDLAQRRRRGAAWLGVLKADVDGLGAAIAETLSSRDDPRALKELSQALDTFFAQTLEREKSRPGSPWADVYTVFSGGDDLLAVGPWDLLFDYAAFVQRLFLDHFGPNARASPSPRPLTLSAGIAVIKPRYPIHLAAGQADELLDRAKSECAPRAAMSKDQCAALGQVWKWRDHEAILHSAKTIADWVEAGVIQRGWLHTVFELVQLRRGESIARGESIVPELAASRLAYHVGRNWPRLDGRDPEAAAARRWIEEIRHEFDRFETTTHMDTLYLPAILRYALLATRSGSGED